MYVGCVARWSNLGEVREGETNTNLHKNVLQTQFIKMGLENLSCVQQPRSLPLIHFHRVGIYYRSSKFASSRLRHRSDNVDTFLPQCRTLFPFRCSKFDLRIKSLTTASRDKILFLVHCLGDKNRRYMSACVCVYGRASPRFRVWWTIM